MKLHDAEKLATSMMEEEGLIGEHGYDPRIYNPKEWSFGFDNAQERLGACSPHDYKITLSRAMVELNGEGVIRAIMLHEIAHAIVERRIGYLFVEEAKAEGCERGDEISDWRKDQIRRWTQYKPHGQEWKDIAKCIGADPRSTCEDPKLVSAPRKQSAKQWIGTCPSCGYEIDVRSRRRNCSCHKCSGGVYTEQYRLAWTEVAA